MQTTVKNNKMKTIPLGLAAYGFTGSNEIQSSPVTITPTMAKEWLKKNNSNRPLNSSNLKTLKRNIEKGFWKITPDAICFDSQGNHINGQHRLTACLETGKNIIALVAINMPPECFIVTDSGKRRSLADSLAINGNENYSILAASAKFVHGYKNDKFLSAASRNPDVMLNSEGFEFAKDNTKLQDICSWVVSNYQKSPEKLIRPTIVAGMVYIMSEKGNEKKAKEFFESILSGFVSDRNSPIAVLLKLLRSDKVSKRDKMTTRHKMAMIIKTWNAFVAGKSLKHLRYNTANKFPTFK